MEFPSSNDFYNPILEYFYNKIEMEKYINNEELRNFLINKFKLTKEQIELTTGSGANELHSSIAWTITFLCKAGLLERPNRGFIQITEEGRKLHDSKIEKIDTNYLKEHYPEFKEFMGVTKKDSNLNTPLNKNNIEIEEVTNELYQKIDEYYEFIENKILKNLHDISKNKSSTKKGDILEDISVELFEKMGYFDVRKTGGTNDGGIDGDFAIDKFGLERVAFQCKFFLEENSVTSKDIDAFAGSLSKLGYQKGVFITTSKFTKSSEYKNITFIDGRKLANLMRENEILCNVINTYKHYSLE